MINNSVVNKTIAFWQDLIVRGQYTINETVKDIPIYKTETSGNVFIVYLLLDDMAIGNITKVRLIDRDGDTFAEKTESIQKVINKGILFSFKFTTTEVQ